MTAGGDRRRQPVLRARLVAALGLVTVTALAAGLPAAADPTPSPTGAPPLPVTIRLVTLTPTAPQSGDVLQVTVGVRNVSPDPVSNLRLELLYSPSKIGSRSEFDAYGGQSDGSLPSDARDTGAEVTLPSPTLAPAAAETAELSVPVDSLDLSEPWQVYELAVQATGDTASGNIPVGRLRTFLPWAPVNVPGVGKPTQVAWVWPLVDRPHRTGGDQWQDDALGGALGGSGRLGGLLAAGAAAQTQHAPPPKPPAKHHRRKRPTAPPKPVVPVSAVPLTWAIDPMLVDDAATMSRGYRVPGRARPVAGTGVRAAQTWLAELKRAVPDGEVLGLPYGDPDLVAAVRGGLATEVQVATTAGQALLARVLGVSPLAYAWPPAGQLDQHTLDALFAGGVTTVVLDGGALPIVSGEPNATPGALTSVNSRDGSFDALLSDPTLSAVVQDGATEPSRTRLDLQRFLAETLMIQAEQPFIPRSVVIAPDRRWAPSPGYAAALLRNTGRVPWIQPVTLSDVAAGPPYTAVDRGPLAYPPSARAEELPHDYVAAVGAVKHELDVFASVLPPGDQQVSDFDEALLRTLSSAWRADLTDAITQRQTIEHALSTTMNKVRITSKPGSLVTLTSHSGQVPVTVANELDTPVRIVIGVDAGQRLRVGGGGRVARTIPPHRQVPVDVNATAQTAGVFPLTVTLYAPNGARYGKPVEVFVRSTAYGAVALLITGGAAGALLLTVAVRLVRRARAGRRTVREAT